MEELVIIGAGGHANVIADMARRLNYNILGFLDDDVNKKTNMGLPVLGKVSDATQYNSVKFIIAIGNNRIRAKIAERYPLDYATLIHPSAQIGSGTEIRKGTVVMANAVINASSTIGYQCIVNSSSVVEHDCNIGNFSHISSRAVLCSTVNVGSFCQIGAGAVIRDNITICNNALVGVGTVVVRDIIKPGVYIGTPAQELKKK